MGTFFNCDACGVVFRDPQTFLNRTSEKSRYDKHKNDIKNKGFQNSVRPLFDRVLNHFPSSAKGLDYGCGNGPVAASMLQKEGYNITLYDPFYMPDKTVLEKTYDFIVCNEVMEHFYDPFNEFQKLNSLLKQNGLLICQTGILSDTIDFDNWYYKNDPTHVVFYTQTSIAWIKEHLGFSSVEVDKNLITFQK